MIHSRLMKTLFLTAMLFLAFAAPARAVDPVTFEDEYVYGIHFSSFTSATTKTEDIAGIQPPGSGISYSTRNVVGFTYAIYADGADATFTISQTTRTYPRRSGYAPAISTSTPVMALNGVPLSGEFQALTSNPVFNFDPVDINATYYIWVEFGRMKRP
jgi:hypothetical protein